MSRGGARKGAGRRPGQFTKYGELTKPMRVPVSMEARTQKFLLLCANVRASYPSAFDDWLNRLFEAFTPKEPEPDPPAEPAE